MNTPPSRGSGTERDLTLTWLRNAASGGSLTEAHGDLPFRAKPLINAFAKKLYASGGKQEQEGVRRTFDPSRLFSLLSSCSPSLTFLLFI